MQHFSYFRGLLFPPCFFSLCCLSASRFGINNIVKHSPPAPDHCAQSEARLGRNLAPSCPPLAPTPGLGRPRPEVRGTHLRSAMCCCLASAPWVLGRSLFVVRTPCSGRNTTFVWGSEAGGAAVQGFRGVMHAVGDVRRASFHRRGNTGTARTRGPHGGLRRRPSSERPVRADWNPWRKDFVPLDPRECRGAVLTLH